MSRAKDGERPLIDQAVAGNSPVYSQGRRLGLARWYTLSPPLTLNLPKIYPRVLSRAAGV